MSEVTTDAAEANKIANYFMKMGKISILETRTHKGDRNFELVVAILMPDENESSSKATPPLQNTAAAGTVVGKRLVFKGEDACKFLDMISPYLYQLSPKFRHCLAASFWYKNERPSQPQQQWTSEQIQKVEHIQKELTREFVI